MYRLSTLLTFLALSAGLASAQTVQSTAGYDSRYDNPNTPTIYFTCGDQLAGKYPELGSFRAYPYVGGSETISDPESPNCGGCYRLTYYDRSIFVVAIDRSDKGFSLSATAFRALTAGAPPDSTVDVSYEKVDPYDCGL